jgi:hypothetical protein
VKENNSRLNIEFSRRSFLTRAAAAGGGAVLLDSTISPKAQANENEGSRGSPGLCNSPVPIPHFNGLHFFFPGPVEGIDPNTGHDPSLIFNFNGFVGGADFAPIPGTGINLNTGATAAYTFHADIRFMTGEFVGTDGNSRHGSFVFI